MARRFAFDIATRTICNRALLMPVTFANASKTISAKDSVNADCAANLIVTFKPAVELEYFTSKLYAKSTCGASTGSVICKSQRIVFKYPPIDLRGVGAQLYLVAKRITRRTGNIK